MVTMVMLSGERCYVFVPCADAHVSPARGKVIQMCMLKMQNSKKVKMHLFELF